ncbi:hypothetical protein LTR37_013844 [Vermiconidia calcicola]|uniref:Uncharacterized protein n=1 Tax=Vermiconidia calcicola TaxID=1690605 RepID=A0ACC3MY37_9PEZI|nr:hypothetical protein LTR37_013844 [Vermiconidia calcicola]
MSSFSSILSSIGSKPTPQNGSSSAPRPSQPGQQPRQPNEPTNGARLTPNNAVAGVKRRSEEPETSSRPKIAKTGQIGLADRPKAVPLSNRFQLSSNTGASPRPAVAPARASNSTPSRPGVSGSIQRPAAKPTASATPTPPSTANGAPSGKRGFASIMEKAKAAQEAAKAAGPALIKHKPVEKMTKRERLRMIEEQKTQEKAAKSGKPIPAERSRSGTPVAGKAVLPKKTAEPLSYKGTMKKAPAEPLSYKGTMRAVAPGHAKKVKEKKKGEAQDKYGGYASWSDLDDAEDEEEEEGYGSEGSSDMDAGFDDMQAEELMSARVAHKEDLEAAAEEARLKKEKEDRKRRLQELSKSAAGRKKY